MSLFALRAEPTDDSSCPDTGVAAGCIQRDSRKDSLRVAVLDDPYCGTCLPRVGFINYEDVTAGVWQDDGTVVDRVSYDNLFFLGTGAVYVWVWDAVWTTFIFLVWTSYYWVAGKLLNVDASWRNWLGFTCWTAVPAILGSVADVLYFKLTGYDPFVLFTSFPWFRLSPNSNALVGIYWIPIR